MSTSYSNRVSKPIGVSQFGLGGAGFNLGLDALAGETELITVFDDFNGVVPGETFGDVANWETMGWVLTDVGVPASDVAAMNPAATVTAVYNSCISIDCGTAADTGGNMQLDRVNATLPASAGGGDFPHIWLAETAAGAAALDNMTFIFACRLGVISNAATFDGKLFIGWAEAGDTSVMTAATGAITIASTGPLVGFHLDGDTADALRGVSHRTNATAIAEGTNIRQLLGAAVTTGYTAGVPRWFDLALRMQITDMSDNNANGTTDFYIREVPQSVGNRSGNRMSPLPAESLGWKYGRGPGAASQLTNQTPNNDVALVPTIEAINGPTNQSDFLIDWWLFGATRASR